jgi:hypothetical protein
VEPGPSSVGSGKGKGKAEEVVEDSFEEKMRKMRLETAKLEFARVLVKMRVAEEEAKKMKEIAESIQATILGLEKKKN